MRDSLESTGESPQQPAHTHTTLGSVLSWQGSLMSKGVSSVTGAVTDMFGSWK